MIRPWSGVAVRLLRWFLLGISLGCSGCSRNPPHEAKPPAMSPLNTSLAELCRVHGIPSTPQQDWLVFPNRNMRARASVSKEIENPKGRIVQLDVQLEI